jgi:hypothetical protein
LVASRDRILKEIVGNIKKISSDRSMMLHEDYIMDMFPLIAVKVHPFTESL